MRELREKIKREKYIQLNVNWMFLLYNKYIDESEKRTKMGFESEYASVKYIKEDNVIFLIWKKEAHLDDYRNPTLFALDLLRKHDKSNFVVDARNGFEDDKRDVDWGFKILLPAMSETTCKYVCFIMNEVNDIEEEMDMWTLEFKKYFTVVKVRSYEEAIGKID